MKISLYQIDTFCDSVFHGNPAAVCPLEAWLPDETLQAIATENNLSETAFLVPRADDFELRWFTPTTEVGLCGHATLASAFVIFTRLQPTRTAVAFHAKAGVLRVSREGQMLVMDFPSRRAQVCPSPGGLSDALGKPPKETLVYYSHEVVYEEVYVAVYSDEKDVASLQPDFSKLIALGPRTVVATAPGKSVDFVSRYFAPSMGVPEDPVTGSTHCILIPYWAERLRKKSLIARQVSRRGGELVCENQENRVRIGGRAALYLEGTIFVNA